MSQLAQEKCEACSKDAPKLNDEQIEELLKEVPEWNVETVEGEKRLTRTFKFKDFAGAFAFTRKVADIAEEEGHHPAILTEYGKTTVDWWTHIIGGLHRNDFVMAARTDRLY